MSRRKSVRSERYDPESDDTLNKEKVIYPKSDEERESLEKAIKGIFIFRELDADQFTDVVDAMYLKEVQPDEQVIQEGDTNADSFFVISSGNFDIYVGGKKTGTLHDSGSFGELALMYNMPRSATVLARTLGYVWVMDRLSFRRIVLYGAYLKRTSYEKLIQKVPMLKELTIYERMTVADALISKNFKDGERIIYQGDSADCMYFVEDGTVVITAHKMKGNEVGEEREINRITSGGYFGELALVTHQPRAASAFAKGYVKCAMLDIEAFERLLGPCMDIMKRNISNYELTMAKIFDVE